MKVAVIGANGQLGTDVCEVFAAKHEVVPLTHQDIETACTHDGFNIMVVNHVLQIGSALIIGT